MSLLPAQGHDFQKIVLVPSQVKSVKIMMASFPYTGQFRGTRINFSFHFIDAAFFLTVNRGIPLRCLAYAVVRIKLVSFSIFLLRRTLMVI